MTNTNINNQDLKFQNYRSNEPIYLMRGNLQQLDFNKTFNTFTFQTAHNFFQQMGEFCIFVKPFSLKTKNIKSCSKMGEKGISMKIDIYTKSISIHLSSQV